jgi:tRNA1Val (adenine37-N6)-methyltransferase
MSNDYFQFRQFIVHQQRCAMKVGTDGTLLGAWAAAPSVKCRILDIGTGTGLIALMMAQRFPESEVIGIDIDPEAVAQARENVRLSPFSEQITIEHQDLMKFIDTDGFDVIVSNPPYFVDSLECPDDQRTMARHTVSLTYDGLIRQAFRLLKDDGSLSLVIPAESRPLIESAASLSGFFLSRVCLVKTTPRKQPKRQLIEFRKHSVKELIIEEGIIEDSPNIRSAWYQQLTKDFYIK